jgi:cold shock CspA family protein
MRYEGSISVWINGKNFGFIVTDGESQRLFLHRSKIKSGQPAVGAKVVFDISPLREGANPSAINVEIVGQEVR